MARRILFRDVDVIATCDARGRELRSGWLLVEGNRIAALGEGNPPRTVADEVIDGRGRVMIPGLINTHHHFYQALFRAVPGALEVELFDWLVFLYERWRGIDAEAVHVSAAVAAMELLLSGCTTTTDHLYLFPSGASELVDAEIEAVAQVGLRFHPTRGSMSLSRDEGGLPPPDVVQDIDTILADSQRLIARYQDPSPGSMLRIALAPCSPFSVTPELMRQTARLAREHGLLLHTHLAETRDEEAFCVEKFGMRPVDYLEAQEWLADDVWLAHLVHLSPEDIARLARAGVAMAHCPSSNMLLGSGIAPVPAMRAAGMAIGLGVDGSASNDASNMIREVRQAFLLARVGHGAAAFSARDALALGTLGGARVLHREDELGSLEEDKLADLALFELGELAFAGAGDPVAALVHCAAQYADCVMVDGEVRVRGGEPVGVELDPLLARHRAIARRLQRQMAR